MTVSKFGFVTLRARPHRQRVFMSSWNGTTVGDLFERIRVSMPPGSPGTLPATDKVDIVAYLRQSSTFPAGQLPK